MHTSVYTNWRGYIRLPIIVDIYMCTIFYITSNILPWQHSTENDTIYNCKKIRPISTGSSLAL